MDHFDVLIVGAGLSGIGAAWHLQDKCKGKSFAILESRDAIGGTWDLFRYPGIRSDSDMYTLGYKFRPWTERKAIADGPDILRYVRDTAQEAGIDRKIRFGHKVTNARFDSATGRWTVLCETSDGPVSLSASFLLMCAGYYSYDKPHNPRFEGEERFEGPMFHAQFWPESLDYAGKRVVVIGSGATAVTIVPVIAKSAAHVTMLQRSPTWMVSRPSEDRIANLLRKLFPPMTAYNLVRWRNILVQRTVFNGARRNPQTANKQLLALLAKELPSETIEAHFTPRYNVWDQRLCLVPDSDFFNAVKAGTADIVTDEIAEIEAWGIALKSGAHLDADIIVKATGISVQVLGGAAVEVDGATITPSEKFLYRGMMLQDVPNLIYVFGYFNASWTLRADLTAEYACRLLNEMEKRGMPIAVPVMDGAPPPTDPPLLNSGYVQRADKTLPRQAADGPWRDSQDYLFDRKMIGKAPLDDGLLQFRLLSPGDRVAVPLATAAE
jgi:cation diffusion facilitator CzcD-associated flavoprotein CzcO